MHDDQHGTAIISAAALKNALDITNKNISEVQIVVNGAGAAAISCTKLYISLGAKLENIIMCDSKGVIRMDRDQLSHKVSISLFLCQKVLSKNQKNQHLWLFSLNNRHLAPSIQQRVFWMTWGLF